ncbi:choice-of-anchor A family protein [Hyalangium rubrum]|uniref:Choice-of-anchor A family protein n=1 Tax=Hyalangium rubrum TaxID=3103134 RepID=A0ABU5H2P8_9BACT|nr:choice-of-anchor A family protein [Hyalangium sp. s54d21]MDY7227736.1 choice-of-anchor A family protein [Hyalangium sp. s54d21]
MKKHFISLLVGVAFAAAACSAQPSAEPAPEETKGESAPLVLASVNVDNKTRSSLTTKRSGLTTAAASAVVYDEQCFARALPANDDGSTANVALPFALNFFGQTYSEFFINNNGNVTFNAPMRTYTPFALTSTTPPIIAAFLADVDTRGSGSGLTTYSAGTFDFQGRPAFCVSWIDVGYYSAHTDKKNTFQLLLVDRTETGAGNFDIVLNYDTINWETGDASGGRGGFGGTSAGAGFSAGNGNPDAFYSFPGSLVHSGLLDLNTDTGLIHSSRNSPILGRYIFQVRNGTPDVTPPVTTATIFPASPDANGEYHAPVSITLNATDDDSGVASITYALSGATTGGATVAGDEAHVPVIAAYGTTTVTFYAVDVAGNVEELQTLTITITPEDVPCTAVDLNDYNLFLAADYTNGHDVQGKVAAGGNVSMDGFAVGAGLQESDTQNVFVVGGDLTMRNGAVFGDTFYGNSVDLDGTVTFPRGTLAQGTPIDFTARFSELNSLSTDLGGRAANGTTRIEPWGGIFLEGTASDLNIFEVQASDIANAKYFSISVPFGSFVVVNFRGAAFTFTGFGHGYSGVDQTGILFNFPEATSINAFGYGFWGTVLAPQAAITFDNGSWDGGIYAYSLSGTAEGHINPLRDYEFCTGNNY